MPEKEFGNFNNPREDAKTSQERGPEKHSYDIIDEIPKNTLDSPRIIRANLGELAYGSDIGVGYPKPQNEDALVLNTKADSFAAIDGIGGFDNADKAAQIMAQEIQNGFRENSFMSDVQKRAHLKMREAGIRPTGVSYMSCEIDGGALHINQAGDVRLIIIGRDNTIRFETHDEGIGSYLTNSVTTEHPGLTTSSSVKISEGDRIILATDGLWKNLDSETVAKLTEDKSIKDAIFSLNSEAKNRMKKAAAGDYSQGHPDNISIIIYDIKSAPEAKLEQIKYDTKIIYTTEKITTTIEGAGSFEDVFSFLKKIGGIQGAKRYFSSDELVQTIENVRNNKQSVKDITRVCGLRSKIIELLKGKKS